MFEIFQYDFMIRAFVAGVSIAIIAPMIGLFLVVRRYSYMADTLAHVSLVGVALGVLAGVNPILPAIGVATLASLAIEKLRENKRLFGESILALFLSGSLALAVVLMSLSNGFQGDLLSYLFGSITTVSFFDTVLIGALMVIPVVTALQLGQSFKKTFISSILFSVVSTVVGLFLSFYLNLSSGGTIVLVALFFFLVALFLNRKK